AIARERRLGLRAADDVVPVVAVEIELCGLEKLMQVLKPLANVVHPVLTRLPGDHRFLGETARNPAHGPRMCIAQRGNPPQSIFAAILPFEIAAQLTAVERFFPPGHSPRPIGAAGAKEDPMSPRISYVQPSTVTDEAMLAEFDRCAREGTPR